MEWLALLGALAVFVVPAFYMMAISTYRAVLPTLRNKRICLLIAHPDDEAMFFAPSVLALTRPETGNQVKILCLSSGDAAGLGPVRKKELVKSGLVLGLRAADDVFVYDEPSDFPDSMAATWDPSKIASLLSAFGPPPSPPPPPSAAAGLQNDSAAPAIDILVTFDRHGVSSHPNHVSLYHGARRFLSETAAASSSARRSHVSLYTLTSVSLVRKYTGMLDGLAALFLFFRPGDGYNNNGQRQDQRKAEHDQDEPIPPTRLVFFNALFGSDRGLATAWRAMTEAHKSQMVWFRWAWIAMSRYMYVNELRLEHVHRGKNDGEMDGQMA